MFQARAPRARVAFLWWKQPWNTIFSLKDIARVSKYRDSARVGKCKCWNIFGQGGLAATEKAVKRTRALVTSAVIRNTWPKLKFAYVPGEGVTNGRRFYNGGH